MQQQKQHQHQQHHIRRHVLNPPLNDTKRKNIFFCSKIKFTKKKAKENYFSL